MMPPALGSRPAQTTAEDVARIFNATNGNLMTVTDVDAANSGSRSP